MAKAKHATKIVAKLEEKPTEEKKALISEKNLKSNPLYQALNANNIKLAEELIKGISLREIRQALGRNIESIVDLALEKNATNVVAALLG